PDGRRSDFRQSKNPHWAGGLVLLRLGGLRLSCAAPERLPRSQLSFAVLRYCRDQHFVLSTAAARSRRGVDRTRLRESPLPVHCKTLAALHARSFLRRFSPRRMRSPCRLRRVKRRRKARRRAAAIPFFLPPLG